MSIHKERIDILLVQQGLFATREKAKAAVMAGLVFLDGNRLEKSGMKVPTHSIFTVKGEVHPYVSRGGLKLEKAIHHFALNLEGVTMLDIGASTGGFTDCALQHGAAHVYAIDVGYNQLDWSIRTHPKVHVMERMNFRYAKPEDLSGPKPNFATIDVSFISLRHMLPPLNAFLSAGDRVVTLIKPQFEAGRAEVASSGIVREAAVHRGLLQQIVTFANSHDYRLEGLTYSPITGGEGNIEFLALWSVQSQHVQSGSTSAEHVEPLIHQVVEEAHLRLAKN